MANPYFHAVSSAKTFGGTPEQYQELHDWFDATKELHGDFRHRALRHHTHGCFEAERLFGTTLTIRLKNGKTKEIPTRVVAEQHIIEDMGFLPTLGDWLKHIQPQPWMTRSRRLSKELA